jgi:hypothetical protein
MQRNAMLWIAMTLFVAACTPAALAPHSALCDGTRAARTAHAAALANTTDTATLRTGALLIYQIDAGCSAG